MCVNGQEPLSRQELQRMERELQRRDQRHTEEQQAEEAALELQKQASSMATSHRAGRTADQWRAKGTVVLGEQMTSTSELLLLAACGLMCILYMSTCLAGAAGAAARAAAAATVDGCAARES